MQCPACRHENPVGFKYCGECGCKFNPQDIVDRKSEIGERKHATVLFSDLSNYTSLTEKLDPEIIKATMGLIFKATGKLVQDYGGKIERFLGDEIMALFGIPKAHEEDAIHALIVAREIHRIVSEMSAEFEISHGMALRMHTGINTGLIITGNEYIANARHGLTGDTINLAKRIAGIAQPGEILIGPATYRLACKHFDFVALEPLQIKGKLAPARIFKVTTPKKIITDRIYRPRIGLERQIYSPMMGRDEALIRLKNCIQQLLFDGQGAVATITGEPGVGKSRLYSELLNDREMQSVTVLEGRAISIGRNLSFHPIADLLKGYMGIRESDSEEAGLQKLRSAIKASSPDEAAEIIPFVATLMGISLTGRYAKRIADISGEALERLILKSIKDLLIAAARRFPLLVVMEDLHWADNSSIGLLTSLYRLAETEPIVFLNIFRSSHPETGGRIMQTLDVMSPKHCCLIDLAPLSNRMSEKLIDNMLNFKGLRSSAKERIIQRAGGNPFFIEEVLRSFIDAGLIVSTSGQFVATDRIDTMVIPNTIRDVLMARIDRLDWETRNLLIIASVIGIDFLYPVLLEVAGNIDDIDGRLRYLKEIQLIRESRRQQDVVFHFKHALAQETAYESILHAQKRDIHRRVAESIEKLFHEKLYDFSGELAYHYSQAEDFDKAEGYLIMAGEEALKSSATSEAVHFYMEAFAFYRRMGAGTVDPEKVAMFEKNIALALFGVGKYVEAVAYFSTALDYHWGKPSMADVSGLFHLLLAIYFPFLKFNKTPCPADTEALELFNMKCKALAIIDPKRFFLEFLRNFKHVTEFNLSGFGTGFEVFTGASPLFSFTGLSFGLSRKVLTYAKAIIDPDNQRSRILYDFAETIHHYTRGNWKKISAVDDRLVAENLNIGEAHLASQHYYWHGFAAVYHHNPVDAEVLVKKLDSICTIYENDLSVLLKLLLNMQLLMEQRKFLNAMYEIDQGIDFIKKNGFTISLLTACSCKAYLAVLADHFDEADVALRQAADIKSEMRAVPTQLSNYYRSRLFYFLRRLETGQAGGLDKNTLKELRRKARKAGKLAVRNARKTAHSRVEIYRQMGSYFWLVKKQDKALEWWRRTIVEGKRLDARLELSRAYAEIGKRLSEPGSGHKKLEGMSAGKYLEKAGGLFREMELGWDLDQLDRIQKDHIS